MFGVFTFEVDLFKEKDIFVLFCFAACVEGIGSFLTCPSSLLLYFLSFVCLYGDDMVSGWRWHPRGMKSLGPSTIL